MKRLFFLVFACAMVAIPQLALNGIFVGSIIDYCTAHGGNTVCQDGDTQNIAQTAATFADGSSAGTSLVNRGDGAGQVSLSGKQCGMWNDGTNPGGTGRSVGFLCWSVIDLTSASATTVTAVNTMDDYGAGGAPDAPTGWKGKSTSADLSSSGLNWKTNGPCLTWGGYITCNIIRQGVAAFYGSADGSLVTTPDGGAHWCNPASLWAHATAPACDVTNWSPTGDAPSCGALATGSLCLNLAYLDATHSSIMWKAPAPYDGTNNHMGRIFWFDYCQANGCSGMPHGADTYLYGYGCTGRYQACVLFRVAKSGGIGAIMNPASYEWYSQANYSNSNVGDGTSWTSTLASAVNVFVATQSAGLGTSNTAQGYTQSFGMWGAPIYICSNGGCGYAMATNIQILNNSHNQFQVVTMPTPWGPFTLKSQIEQPAAYYEFMNLLRWTAYSPDSTPYHSIIGMEYDNTSVAPSAKSAFFRRLDISLAPGEVGALPRGQSGLKFTYAPTAGAMIGRGIVFYTDMWDHKGLVDWPTIGSLDISHQSSSIPLLQLIGCWVDGGTTCGIPNSSKGLVNSALGWGFADNAGFTPYGEVRDNQLNSGSGNNRYNTSSDTTFSSNGSYTIPMIAMTTDISANQGFFNAGPVAAQLYIYNFSGAPGGISISYQPSSGVFVGVGTPNSTITNNTWFQATFTHAASTHVCNVYINGVLIATGVPSTTPNVGAGSITVGRTSAGAGNSVQGGMAGIGWYNRVLTANEIMHNYKVLKANVAKRGITLP